MEAYLDNSATTCVYQETADLVCDLMVNHYGNPSAMHQKGVEAEQYIRTAQETLAKILKVKEKEIFFTSGGTESDNWALVGTAMANKRTGNHIITSAIEHPAVSAPLAFLEEQGFRITRLPVNKEGLVDVNELEEAITPETILVSIMYVNNEIGAVEPIGEIGRRIKAKNPKTYFHVDAIQAFGKYRIYPKRMGIDMLSVSGHKIHAPKGIGALYLSDRLVQAFRPPYLGGEQERGLRPGTENLPYAMGLAAAATRLAKTMKSRDTAMKALNRRLRDGLKAFPEVELNSPENAVPEVLNFSENCIKSETMLAWLAEAQVYVSSASACGRGQPSHTLAAMGKDPLAIDTAIRVSFCGDNTPEDVDAFLNRFEDGMKHLQKIRK
mgnify:CR=1 FL=1